MAARSGDAAGRPTRPDDRIDDTVSVVLPTRNRGAVLGGAIESVLSQSYDAVELHVVDSASTDGTAAAVESIADARVRYDRCADSVGVSAARNRGIRATDGAYVAFIDSDDRWHPDKLERQVAALERAGAACGVAYTGIAKAYGEPLTRDGASGDVYDAVRSMSVPTYTSTLLIRRTALERCGLFDEALDCFEDWELCLRLAAAYTFTNVAEPLVTKGTAGDNVSADPDRVADAVERLRRRYALPPPTLARLLADAGVTYCEAGRLREGRGYLRRALRRNPRQPNAVAAFLLSLPDEPTVFDVGMNWLYALERRVATA